MTDRKVTERDFRKSEFCDANPDDYEFRQDGAIVRKDRWRRGIEKIAFRLLYKNGRGDYEIDNLIVAIEWLLEQVPNIGELEGCGVPDHVEPIKKKVTCEAETVPLEIVQELWDMFYGDLEKMVNLQVDLEHGRFDLREIKECTLAALGGLSMGRNETRPLRQKLEMHGVNDTRG